MTLAEIKDMIVACDPNAGHYESAYRGASAYTVWQETRELAIMADDLHQGGWAFQIDRYTKNEDDAIAYGIRAALDGDERIAYSHLVDFEPETGYIHHIYDCEGY